MYFELWISIKNGCVSAVYGKCTIAVDNTDFETNYLNQPHSTTYVSNYLKLLL